MSVRIFLILYHSQALFAMQKYFLIHVGVGRSFCNAKIFPDPHRSWTILVKCHSKRFEGCQHSIKLFDKFIKCV